MTIVVSLLAILGALVAGLLLGLVPAVRLLTRGRVFSLARAAVLALLVGVMGFRIGRSAAVFEDSGTLGLASLAFAVATMAGTLAVLAVAGLLRERRRKSPPPGAAPPASPVSWRRALRDPVLLLLALGCGVLAGRLLRIFPGADGSVLITWILYALLLIVGLGLAASDVRVKDIVTHPDLLVTPLGTMVGSLLGGLCVGLLLGMRPGTSLSVAAGFGWYSLSGVILTRLDGPAIGAVAFLSNMVRESLALLLIPVLGRSRFPLLAVGAGGATSMDVTLLSIYKACGERMVPVALASGAILSASVPVLVPLLYSL